MRRNSTSGRLSIATSGWTTTAMSDDWAARRGAGRAAASRSPARSVTTARREKWRMSLEGERQLEEAAVIAGRAGAAGPGAVLELHRRERRRVIPHAHRRAIERRHGG